MRTFRDAKAMAKSLRDELARRDISLPHGACLEIVARQFGLTDWNVLAAKIATADMPTEEPALPLGWYPAGKNAADYTMGVDPGMLHPAGGVAMIQRLDAERDDNRFGTLMQTVAAATYAGKRVVLAADLRVQDVRGWATLWLRADDATRRRLVFDNRVGATTDGPINGTSGWMPRRIVLDIPRDADTLHFGFLLKGVGTAWAAAFTLREAGPDEEASLPPTWPSRPRNLDFTQAG